MDAIQISQIQRHLGLCQRASKTLVGDVLFESLKSKSVKLVMLATDASPRTKSQYEKKCAHYNVDLIECLSIEELSTAIGKVNRVAIGITDAGFAKLIKNTIRKGED